MQILNNLQLPCKIKNTLFLHITFSTASSKNYVKISESMLIYFQTLQSLDTANWLSEQEQKELSLAIKCVCDSDTDVISPERLRVDLHRRIKQIVINAANV